MKYTLIAIIAFWPTFLILSRQGHPIIGIIAATLSVIICWSIAWSFENEHHH
jgi:hypothetical protein